MFIENTGINVRSSKVISDLYSVISGTFSANYSGTIQINLTKNIKSDYAFGRQFEKLKEMNIPKKSREWYKRSAIQVKGTCIAFSAIKNNFEKIDNYEREHIELIIKLSDEYLSTHPLRVLSNKVRFYSAYKTLKVSDGLSNSISNLGRQFEDLDDCLKKHPAYDNDDTLNKSYEEFNQLKKMVRKISDGAVIELMNSAVK